MIVEYQLVDKTCPSWVANGGYIPDAVADSLIGFLKSADFPSVRPGYLRTLTRYATGTHAVKTSEVNPWHNQDGTIMTATEVRNAAYTIVDAYDEV